MKIYCPICIELNIRAMPKKSRYDLIENHIKKKHNIDIIINFALSKEPEDYGGISR